MKTSKAISIIIAAFTFYFTSFPFLATCQSEKVKTIEAYEIGSLDSILNLKEFSGKTVYIDIWGVHCIPCIEEFDFNESLRNRFKGEPVEFLYLSLDYGHKDDKNLWHKMIHDKNLVGYNVFISAKLYLNIWKSIQDSINKKYMYLIPHYIITDPKGKIAFADAARPSTHDSLYHQIEAVVRKKEL
jgi:thiol-disulfide isomerase/thioredoxin